MNRPIKFRAWDNRLKKMNYAPDYDGMSHKINDQFNEKSYQKDLIWMQFTGLLDKNGREIYEGDVYRHITESTSGFEVLMREEIGIVKWKEGVCSVGFQFLTHYSNIEIIGDIYENPELLEVE